MTDLNVVFSISYLIWIWLILVWRHLLTTGIQKAFWWRPQTHGPVWIGMTIHTVHVQGTIKIGVFGGDTSTRNTVIQKNSGRGISSSHMKIVRSSTGSGGGDPYCTLWIFANLGSAEKFLNPDPDPFALVLVQFADPDLVRIRHCAHFMFSWFFWQVRIRGSGSGFASHSGSFWKILTKVFLSN